MIPRNITRAHTERALDVIASEGTSPQSYSNGIKLRLEGAEYPAAWVIALSNEYANGELLSPKKFTDQEAVAYLKSLGYPDTFSPAMSVYERNALKQIHEWKSAEPSWFDRATDVVSWPLKKAAKLVNNFTGIETVLTNSVSGLVSLLNDTAQWSVRPPAIYEEFRRRGHSISAASDIFRLDLEEVDKTIGWLDNKYKGLTAGEGAVTGVAGLPGIPADIVALVGLNLRAVGEYATYCGFDVSLQHERLFALNVLSLSSSPSEAGKAAAMSQLVRIAMDVARKVPWKQLEGDLFVQAIKKLAQAVGIRLTKAKLAQILPVLGSVVSAGFNAYYTNKVCEAAYNLYRERFLAQKYGEVAVEETVKPAELATSLLAMPADVEEPQSADPTYGSQFHLRGWVNGRSEELGELIRAAYVQVGSKPPKRITWHSPLEKDGFCELEGMEFFATTKPDLVAAWKEFWPQSGTSPMWDAWADVEGSEGREILLVEAKANDRELRSSPCGASEPSLQVILSALSRTKEFLGVKSTIPWHLDYYQYSNRLACLYFLNEMAKTPARFLNVYFTGDRFPDGRRCPESKQVWSSLVDEMYSALGLSSDHPYKANVLSIYPPAQPPQ